MGSVYDISTLAAFGVLVGYFIFLTDRNPRLLGHFLISAIAFAVANQLGNLALEADNAALHALAIVLIVVGVAYAAIMARSLKLL
jgi:uncharacterized membrane protein YjjP (DUF1212 family)